MSTGIKLWFSGWRVSQLY